MKKNWNSALCFVVFVSAQCVSVTLSSRPWESPARDRFPTPENLVIDFRLFETRSDNPDRDEMGDLSFRIDTDGRGITANQWLATIAKKIPGSFLAALASETVSVDRAMARVSWIHRRRSFDVEIRMGSYHTTDGIPAEVWTSLSRAGEPLRKFKRKVHLQLGQTTIWSGTDLEMHPTDYLSHFREYADSEHRGLLYEKLRLRTTFVLIAATPRLLSPDELPQLSPVKLEPPPGVSLPEMDNPLQVPVQGTVVLGFELGSSGEAINPQIVWSTLPEANPRLLGEVARWRFPPTPTREGKRGWGRVKLHVKIP